MKSFKDFLITEAEEKIGKQKTLKGDGREDYLSDVKRLVNKMFDAIDKENPFDDLLEETDMWTIIENDDAVLACCLFDDGELVACGCKSDKDSRYALQVLFTNAEKKHDVDEDKVSSSVKKFIKKMYKEDEDEDGETVYRRSNYRYGYGRFMYPTWGFFPTFYPLHYDGGHRPPFGIGGGHHGGHGGGNWHHPAPSGHGGFIGHPADGGFGPGGHHGGGFDGGFSGGDIGGGADAGGAAMGGGDAGGAAGGVSESTNAKFDIENLVIMVPKAIVSYLLKDTTVVSSNIQGFEDKNAVNKTLEEHGLPTIEKPKSEYKDYYYIEYEGNEKPAFSIGDGSNGQLVQIVKKENVEEIIDDTSTNETAVSVE